MIESNEEKLKLRQIWQSLLQTLEKSQRQIPFNAETIIAAATSFSFGLDENINPADSYYLIRNFVAYLKTVLDEQTFNKYISPDLSEESKRANERDFDKPM